MEPLKFCIEAFFGYFPTRTTRKRSLLLVFSPIRCL
jgi:hypothetical protein